MSQTEPFTTEISVRYRDLDPENHVNNAVYGTYIEQARLGYLDRVLETRDEYRVVLAHLSIDYQQPVTLSDESVAVTVRTTELNSSSIPMEFELRTSSGVVATGESVMVTVDDDGEPRPIPTAWRDRISSFEPAL
ncbi:acyl-CoA thioesterase [Halocatena pleomorpha]|uniref:Acyl-CoA thioesterase n=1 Tax=Halocatena pleomorpha TaxID=1785090 RepID=A0A3P3RC12_9EURY|nr:thioesterase family protein [Halocatena pleomorpha]RRJ31006.1 acyl-CoA thioesterase [Halocatena pleomorpha]